MDIDALKAARANTWKKLHDLSRRRRITGEQADELARLYRLGTTDLAAVRGQNPDPDLVRALSRDLASARAKLTGTRRTSFWLIARWFKVTLPAALYHTRWWSVGVTVASLLIAGIYAGWLLANPEYFSELGTPTELKQFATDEFVDYYSQDTNAEFASSVWVNNAFIAFRTVGAGITGVFGITVLHTNAQNLGIVAAIVIEHSSVWHFFRFILPHGLPELTAIFISAAAGFRVFWALLVPGPRTRIAAVASAGRSMIVVALGLVILLFISGLIEGYVTPSEILPDWIKITIGTIVTIAVWVYTLVLGKRAAQEGEEGDLLSDRGAEVATAG